MANTKYIICPFYIQQSNLAIVCEGMRSGSTSSMCFDSTEKRDEYRKTHCESFEYEQKCDVCRHLLKNYYK